MDAIFVAFITSLVAIYWLLSMSKIMNGRLPKTSEIIGDVFGVIIISFLYMPLFGDDPEYLTGGYILLFFVLSRLFYSLYVLRRNGKK